jgi:hypothetical protein
MVFYSDEVLNLRIILMKNIFVLGLGVCLVFLGGCEQVKGVFGKTHYQPDEFNVYTNPPLTLPPNCDLKPPMTSSTDTIDESSKQLKTANPNASEVRFVKQLQKDPVNPNIRDQVNAESKKEPDSFISRKIEEIKKNAGSIRSDNL